MKKCTCFFRRPLKFYFKQNPLQGYLVLSELITYIGHYKDLKADVSSVSFLTLYGGQFTLSTQLIILNYRVILSHRCSATVFWETYPQNLWQLSILRLRYLWYRDYGLTSFRHSRVISGCSTFPFVKAFIIHSFGITLLIPINFFFRVRHRRTYTLRGFNYGLDFITPSQKYPFLSWHEATLLLHNYQVSITRVKQVLKRSPTDRLMAPQKRGDLRNDKNTI